MARTCYLLGTTVILFNQYPSATRTHTHIYTACTLSTHGICLLSLGRPAASFWCGWVGSWGVEKKEKKKVCESFVRNRRKKNEECLIYEAMSSYFMQILYLKKLFACETTCSHICIVRWSTLKAN